MLSLTQLLYRNYTNASSGVFHINLLLLNLPSRKHLHGDFSILYADQDADFCFLGLIDFRLPLLQSFQRSGGRGAGLFLRAGGNNGYLGLHLAQEGFAGGVVIPVVAYLQNIRRGNDAGLQQGLLLGEFLLQSCKRA